MTGQISQPCAKYYWQNRQPPHTDNHLTQTRQPPADIITFLTHFLSCPQHWSLDTWRFDYTKIPHSHISHVVDKYLIHSSHLHSTSHTAHPPGSFSTTMKLTYLINLKKKDLIRIHYSKYHLDIIHLLETNVCGRRL